MSGQDKKLSAKANTAISKLEELDSRFDRLRESIKASKEAIRQGHEPEQVCRNIVNDILWSLANATVGNLITDLNRKD